MNIAAIVMASGFSRRMGKNKLLCEINGRTVVEHILDTVMLCAFSFNIVVTQYDEVDKLARKRNMEVVYNKNPEMGQSMSLKLGVQSVDNADVYAFFPADQPFVQASTIKRLIDISLKNKRSIIVSSYKNKRGLPVFFPASFKEELLALTGDKGARELIGKYSEKVIFVDVNSDIELLDIDDENDLIIADNLSRKGLAE